MKHDCVRRGVFTLCPTNKSINLFIGVLNQHMILLQLCCPFDLRHEKWKNSIAEVNPSVHEKIYIITQQMLHLVPVAPCTKVVGTFGRGGDLFDRTFSLSFFPGRLLNRFIRIICSFCFGYSSFRCSARSFREFSISAGSVSQCGPQPIRCIQEKSQLLSFSDLDHSYSRISQSHT